MSNYIGQTIQIIPYLIQNNQAFTVSEQITVQVQESDINPLFCATRILTQHLSLLQITDDQI